VSNVIAIYCGTCSASSVALPKHTSISLDCRRHFLHYWCRLCRAMQTREVCAATAGLLLAAGTSLDVVIPDECPTL